jgi:hypothetical protein
VAERQIEPLVALEFLRKKLLRNSARKAQIPDFSEDPVGDIEAVSCNKFRSLLEGELIKISDILDKMTDGRDAVAIYTALDRAVQWAIWSGRNDPNPITARMRQHMPEVARRARREANIAAQERREAMRPFVEDIAKDFPVADGFRRRVAAIYKALMKRPDFKGVLPKAVNPRQIKGDIEEILDKIDAEAILATWPSLDMRVFLK